MANVWPAPDSLLRFGMTLRKLLKLTAPIMYQQPLPPYIVAAADMPLEELDNQVFQISLCSPSKLEASWLEYYSFNSTRYPFLRRYEQRSVFIRGFYTPGGSHIYTTASSRDDDYYLAIDGYYHDGLIFREQKALESHASSLTGRSSKYCLVGFGFKSREGLYDKDADLVPSDTELEQAMQRLEALESCPLLRRVGSEFDFSDLLNSTINISWLDMLQLTMPSEESFEDGHGL